MFDELVQTVQMDIGKEPAVQDTNRKAFVFACMNSVL
jgi:hypothetical protein